MNPVVDNQPLATATIPGTHTNVQVFLVAHPKSVAFAQEHAALLKLVQQNQAVVVAADLNPTLANHAKVAYRHRAEERPAAQLLKTQFNTLVVPYQAELSYLSAHQDKLTSLQNAVAKSPKQWQNWFWVCVGGHGALHPDHLAHQGTLAPVEGQA